MFTFHAISLRINQNKSFTTCITFSSLNCSRSNSHSSIYAVQQFLRLAGMPHLSFCLSQQYGTSWVPCQVRKSMFSQNQAKSPLRTSSLCWTILRLKLPCKIKARLYISVPGYCGSVAKTHSLTSSYVYLHRYPVSENKNIWAACQACN